ncbi:MAG: type II secretion system protein [Candidatus Riflebacteria bacterium]|nr:type II secretion system protein [Candidatus Riflebacteria bacterium]
MKGFTFVEVLVSTMIMAMMLVSLMSFVQLSSDTWRRTDQSINLGAEGSMVVETIRNFAEKSYAMSPAIGDTSNVATFAMMVATGSPEAGNYFFGVVAVRLSIDAGPPRQLIATYTSYSPPGPGQVSFVPGTAENAKYEISLMRFVGSFTEHLATFSATRISKNSMSIYLLLDNAQSGEIYDETNATPTFEATATFYAPGIQ